MNLVTDAAVLPTNDIIKRRHGNTFIKTGYSELERAMIANEARLLTHLSETGIAPQLIRTEKGAGELSVVMEYVGESQPVTDEVAFRRNCARLLITMRQAGVIHGDLTRYNIIIRNNKPIVVDWAQSRLAHEDGPDKRPEGDAYHLWQAAEYFSPDTARHVRKWQVLREYVKEGSLLDLGCWEGDYTLFALSENPDRQIVGIEGNLANYERAVSMWGRGLISYKYTRLVEKYQPMRYWDSAFLMSVYSYLVEDYGRSNAAAWLGHVVKNTGQLFFENQLYGDGPGPAFFVDDDDIYHFLKNYGKVEKLVTIHVHGREFDRTIWRVS